MSRFIPPFHLFVFIALITPPASAGLFDFLSGWTDAQTGNETSGSESALKLQKRRIEALGEQGYDFRAYNTSDETKCFRMLMWDLEKYFQERKPPNTDLGWLPIKPHSGSKKIIQLRAGYALDRQLNPVPKKIHDPHIHLESIFYPNITQGCEVYAKDCGFNPTGDFQCHPTTPAKTTATADSNKRQTSAHYELAGNLQEVYDHSTSGTPALALFTIEDKALCPRCAEARDWLGQLSDQYTERLRFIVFDIRGNADAAYKQHHLKYLPTFIMFENGKEKLQTHLPPKSQAELESFIKAGLDIKKPDRHPGEATKTTARKIISAENLSQSLFKHEVLDAQTTVLLNITAIAPWCGPCKDADKHITSYFRLRPRHVKYVIIDMGDSIERSAGIIRHLTGHNFTGVPTLIVYKNGKITAALSRTPESVSELDTLIGSN